MLLHCSNPQHISLSMHIKTHCTPTTTHPTTNKHKAYLCKWWQNGTRCRDGVKVLWCHSHLVWLIFDASIPTCTCFPSENFCDLYMYMWLSCAEIKDFSVVYYNRITTFISSSSPGHQKCALPNTFILVVLG